MGNHSISQWLHSDSTIPSAPSWLCLRGWCHIRQKDMRRISICTNLCFAPTCPYIRISGRIAYLASSSFMICLGQTTATWLLILARWRKWYMMGCQQVRFPLLSDINSIHQEVSIRELVREKPRRTECDFLTIKIYNEENSNYTSAWLNAMRDSLLANGMQIFRQRILFGFSVETLFCHYGRGVPARHQWSGKYFRVAYHMCKSNDFDF